MAFTLNRRLAQLIDSNGQLLTGKIPNDYISSDHIADNVITSAMLHTGFTVSTSNLTAIDTDDVSEGSSNLYYTDARVGTYISGNRDYGNITTTGYIAGPATFTIDPAAVGDNTGTVVIAGNLQVDGTTTTINSTTLEVDDLNITLASGAANAAAANGAGITVDGASATITYDGTNDEWDFNKDINVTGTATMDGLTVNSGATDQVATFQSTDQFADLALTDSGGTSYIRQSNGSLILEADRANASAGSVAIIKVDNTQVARFASGGDISFYEDTGTTAKLFWDASAESLGIGTTSPSYKLVLRDDSTSAYPLSLENNNIGTAGVHTGIRFGYTAGSYQKGAIIFEGQDANGRGKMYFAMEGTANSSNADETDAKMTIDYSGNVGIGITNPVAKLDVTGTTTTYPSVYDYLYATGEGIRVYGEESALDLVGQDTGGHSSSILLRNENEGFGIINNPSSNSLQFRSFNATGDDFNIHSSGSSVSNLTDILTLEKTGKVGINDTDPSQMLSVSGTGSVPPARFTATGNTNTLEVWGNATASTSTGILCNAGTNSNDYSAKFRNYAGSTIMEVRGDSLVDTFGGIRLQDSNILAFGQSSDIRAYYDGTDSLYITAVNGTANKIKTNANETYIMQANGNQLITAIANSEVIINNDSSASIDFRVESDNEQYNFFCDASSEIIHFGEGTNSDVQSVIPAKTLAGRRHGYHGGNKQHAGQTFKYSESTGWTDAIKIDWHNVSWGAVCMRITGMYYYNASDNFSIVIGFQGYGEVGSSSYGSTSVSYDATSSGAMTWTNAIQLAQSATGETMIRQRAGDTTGDIIYRYEWQCYARSNQPILIIEQ